MLYNRSTKWNAVVAAVLLAGGLGLVGFLGKQVLAWAGDMESTQARLQEYWTRNTSELMEVTRRLDRIENKLDRVIEGRR